MQYLPSAGNPTDDKSLTCSPTCFCRHTVASGLSRARETNNSLPWWQAHAGLDGLLTSDQTEGRRVDSMLYRLHCYRTVNKPWIHDEREAIECITGNRMGGQNTGKRPPNSSFRR